MTRWQAKFAAMVVIGGSAAVAQPLTSDGPPLAAAAAPSPAAMAPPQTAPLLTTEQLRRAEISDAEGARLGTVTDFVLDSAGPATGRISHVVLELEGVLGVGRHAVAVPYSELQITPSEDGALRIRLPWTETQLRSVPAWNAANPASLGLSGPAPATPAPDPGTEAP